MDGRRARPITTALIALGVAAALAACQVVDRPATDAPTPTSAEAAITTVEPSTPVPLGKLALAIDPIPVRQGGEVRISGRGFGPGETVVVKADDSTGASRFELYRDRASAAGTLDAVAITLPDDLNSGRHDLSAVGQDSGRTSAGVLWIRARDPWVNLPETSMSRYEDFGLIAGGFASGEQVVVSIEPRKDEKGDAQKGDAPKPSPTRADPLDGGTPAAGSFIPTPTPGPVAIVTLSTDTAGNTEWAQIKAPRVRTGKYRLVLRGRTSQAEVGQDIEVKPFTPTGELSPWAGPPGTLLQVNVKGLAPNEVVKIYVGDGTVEAGSSRADMWGNVWSAGPMRLAYGLPTEEKVPVTIVGVESETVVKLDFKVLAPKPWLELTNWWGPPGSSVGFGGGGWAPGEDIDIHVGDILSPVVATARADDFGWLRGGTVARVPRESIVDVSFAAVGHESGAFAVATFKLVFPLGLKPGP